MDLDARAFRCFIAVVETGSFHRAAARMHISQPALSARIRELERRLGFALFERTSRKVTITSEGHLFLPNARRLVQETEVALRAAEEIRTNQLRIATPSYTALIPERRALLTRFVAAHGDAGLRVINDTLVHCLAALRDGDVDLAIVLLPEGPDEAGALHPTMETLTLARRTAGLLLPSGHPLEGHPAPPPAALAGMRAARLSRVSGRELADAVAAWLDQLGLEGVRLPEPGALGVEFAAAGPGGIPAVSLGWWDWPLPGQHPPRRVAIAEPALVTRLALVRRTGRQRTAADRMWALARAFSENAESPRPVPPGREGQNQPNR